MNLAAVSRFGLLFLIACGGIACGGTSTTTEHDGGVTDGAADATHDAIVDAARDASANDAASDSAPDGATSCRGAATGNACVTCCANAFPGGKAELDLVGFNCMCNSCSSACKASTCQANTAPQSPCIACVKHGLAVDCRPDGGAIGQCSTSCNQYVDCISQCAD